MKNHFRASMAWLHTWTGLVCGWLLYLIFLTGSIGYFDTEIDRWMNPQIPIGETSTPPRAQLQAAMGQLAERAPEASRWFIVLPADRNDPVPRILWTALPDADGKPRRGGSALLDPVSGKVLDTHHSGGGQFLYRLHYTLHYMPPPVAYWIVGFCALVMLTALVTGIIVHKKIFTDFFTFRPGKGVRSWLDAHNVLSVTSLPFHLMITYSGLVFFAFTYMPLIAAAHYGLGNAGQEAFRSAVFEAGDTYERSGVAAPLAPLDAMLAQGEARWGAGRVNGIDIRQPGDAQARVLLRPAQSSPLRSTEIMVFDGVSGQLMEIRPALTSTAKAAYDLLLGLHEGLYAGPAVRWLYFLSGLAGSAMIASGLVLWARKRRQRQEKDRNGARHRGLGLVERLNAGTLVGLPIGIVAYFWANRLLPDGLAQRAGWEADILFGAWGIMLLHAALRPRARLWWEQSLGAALLYLSLPVFDVLITTRQIGSYLTEGRAVFAWFDLTLFCMGAAWLRLALFVRPVPAASGRSAPAAPQETRAPQH